MTGLFALPFLLVMIWRLPFDGGFYFADALFLVALLGFGWSCVFCVGLALAKPIGLRVDQHGLSGYYVPTLDWSDINGIIESRDRKTLHVDVRKPYSIVDRFSGWERVRFTMNMSGGAVGVNVSMIDGDYDDIIAGLRERHARYAKSQRA